MKTTAIIRLTRSPKCHVVVQELSREGCKFEFVDRPLLGDRVWVKFEGLETLQGTVTWIEGAEAKVEFERPIHEAVFRSLSSRMS